MSTEPPADARAGRHDARIGRHDAAGSGPSHAVSFWLDGIDRTPDPPFCGAIRADVAIVGGGFTGLWTAIRLLATEPGLRVVVLEAETVGHGASGRNGGFCEASLTHGLANAIAHWPEEARLLEDEGVRKPRRARRVRGRASRRLRPRGHRHHPPRQPAAPGGRAATLGR